MSQSFAFFQDVHWEPCPPPFLPAEDWSAEESLTLFARAEVWRTCEKFDFMWGLPKSAGLERFSMFAWRNEAGMFCADLVFNTAIWKGLTHSRCRQSHPSASQNSMPVTW